MMHGFPFATAPWAPTGLTAAGPVGDVVLNWADNSIVETSLIIEYADNLNGPWTFLTEQFPVRSPTRTPAPSRVRGTTACSPGTRWAVPCPPSRW